MVEGEFQMRSTVYTRHRAARTREIRAGNILNRELERLEEQQRVVDLARTALVNATAAEVRARREAAAESLTRRGAQLGHSW